MVLEDALTQVIREAVRVAIREEIREVAPALNPRTPAAADELLTIAEAAVHAKLSAPTIQKWLRAGKLTRYGKGRNTRVSRAELLRALASDGSAAAKPEVAVDDQAMEILRKGRR